MSSKINKLGKGKEKNFKIGRYGINISLSKLFAS